MAKIKYLITGGSGRLGTQIRNRISSVYPTTKQLDILKPVQIEKYLSDKTVGAVLHLAAVCDMAKTEKDHDLTYRVNVIGTRNIAQAAKKYNKKIIYISSDYIFPGTKGNYKETDTPQPANWYGYTKYAGELEIRNLTDNYLIIRTSFRPLIWSFPTAYTNVYTSADYIDVIADEIKTALNLGLSGIVNIGTPVKTFYDLAKQRNSKVLPEECKNDNFPKRRDLSIAKWLKIKKQS